MKFEDPMDTFRSASNAVANSPEWAALRAEEDRLEEALVAIKEQKRALLDRITSSMPDYP